MSDAILYPVVDKYQWADRYSLPIKSNPCRKCGKSLTADIPFASGSWRGLTSKSHECGDEYDLFVATKPERNERMELIGAFHALSAQLNYFPE